MTATEYTTTDSDLRKLRDFEGCSLTAKVEAHDPVKWKSKVEGMDLIETEQTIIITQ